MKALAKIMLLAGAIVASTLTPVSASVPTTTTAENSQENNAPSAYRDAADGALLLLDTSGSMADEDGAGRVKIDAAKSSILEQIQDMPVTSKIGLMTFPAEGTVASGRCGRALSRLELANNSLVEMGSALGTLPAPNGDTPTGDALLDAAEYLHANGMGNASIILVSDGESTCGEVPVCEVAAGLRAQGIKVAVNTVGFDISGAGEEELRCIAEASGGTYVNAKDAEQLKLLLGDALNPKMNLVVTKPSGPVERGLPSFRISVELSATGGTSIPDVDVTLSEHDTKNGDLVGSHQLKLGNVLHSASGSYKRHWDLKPPANDAPERSYVITATSGLGRTAKEEFKIQFVSSATTGANLAEPLRNFKHVLVVGDSYSSGEGAGDTDRPYFAGTGQELDCHRSQNQYAGWLFGPDQVKILACSGAVSRNLVTEGQNGEESQATQLGAYLDDGQRPDAVFVTLGGNDINFGGIVTDCAMKTFWKLGKDATECMASEKSGMPYQETMGLIHSLEQRIPSALAAISYQFTSRGLETPPLLAMHYPKLLAKDGNGQFRCGTKHYAQDYVLSPSYKDFHELQQKLIKGTQKGFEAAQGIGLPVYIVDNSEHAIGSEHNICSTRPWFFTLTAVDGLSKNPEVLHPIREGHQAMAVSINQWASNEGLKLEPRMMAQEASAYFLLNVILNKNVDLNLDMSASTSADQHQKIGYGSHTVNVSNGRPGATAVVYLKSVPQAMGSVRFNESGEASVTFNIQPTDVQPGQHTVNVIGTNAAGEYTVSTRHIEIKQPFPTIFWGLIAIVVAALLLTLLVRRSIKRRAA